MSVETDAVFAELGSLPSFEEAADGVCDRIKTTFTEAKKASKHNADLLEALTDGGDFRIAFRKPGETEWTRVRFCEEELLRQLAAEEVFARQERVMRTLADILGVDSLEVFV
jgi:carbamate kinase